VEFGGIEDRGASLTRYYARPRRQLTAGHFFGPFVRGPGGRRGRAASARLTLEGVSATTRKSLKTQFDDTRNHSEVTR